MFGDAIMSGRQILYEANLAKSGSALRPGALLMCVVGLAGLVISLISFVLSSFSDIGLLFIAAGFVFLMVWPIVTVSRLRRNPGFYRIYFDTLGLHVQSDDPICGPSFSVSASELYRLVRKVGVVDEPTDYYVEEQSGRRHQIHHTIANSDLDVMAMFRRIAQEFPSVTIVDE